MHVKLFWTITKTNPLFGNKSKLWQKKFENYGCGHRLVPNLEIGVQVAHLSASMSVSM